MGEGFVKRVGYKRAGSCTCVCVCVDKHRLSNTRAGLCQHDSWRWSGYVWTSTATNTGSHGQGLVPAVYCVWSLPVPATTGVVTPTPASSDHPRRPHADKPAPMGL